MRIYKRINGDTAVTGRRVNVMLSRLIRDDEGRPLAACPLDLVTGTISAIGAHWSDQPRGRAGWWAEIDVNVPAELAGMELIGD